MEKNSKKIIISGLILVLIGSFFFIQKTGAASISAREVRISDSTPAASGVTYDFLGTTTASTTKCIKVQFCNSADTSGSCTAPTSIDVSSGAIYDTAPFTWNVFSSTNWTYAAIAGGDANDFKLTYNTGENGGASSSWVVNGITNPVAGTYYAWINTYSDTACTTGIDSGVVATAAVAGVTVSATVSEALTFTVAEVDSGTCTISGGTNRTTTASTMPFGTVNADAFYNGCQSLTVATNAGSGYDVTVGESDQLTSTPNQIPDGACDGSCTETTEAAWATAGNNGFGYCMDDVSGNAAETADAGWATNYCGATPQYFKIIPDIGESEARQNIMQSAGAVSGDTSYVGFRLSVDAAQPSGTYTNTVSYIVTPRY